MAHKIAVTGDINGRLEEFFTKLTTLHAKQNFAFAIIAGTLFSDPASASPEDEALVTNLVNGQIEVPVATYFSLGTHALLRKVVEKLEKDDGELCPNLYLLGRKVSMKTADGFRIVAVGGKHTTGQDDPMSAYDATYTDADAQALAESQANADILVTNDWPAAIRDGARARYDGAQEPPLGVQSIADLCAAVKPRYHFSASASSYEREPFFHPGDRPQAVTRFLSLAPFGNTEGHKWIKAFALEPSAEPPPVLPQGCTASPLVPKKRKLDSQQDSFDNFRYVNGGTRSDHYQPDRRGGKRRKAQPPPTPEDCFFCLKNEANETHMIASLGDESYVAIAKGPLTTKKTYPDLGFPGHMLIIALEHKQTFAVMGEDERKKTETEMQRYRAALHDLLVSKSKGDDGRCKLGAVTWEISRGNGIHLHWQFLPVPVDMVQRGLVEAAFEVEAENLEYPRFAKKASAMADAEKGDHVKVMIWSESLRKEMVLPLDGGFRFDLQYGRKVMAKLLGLMDRMEWRACAQTTEEETADADAFKEAFKESDFTLQEE
ncbi:hypothetical protein LTR09_001249 [Extremus antarcticus]|uniref:Uncharacterized protein n=1 Tax=Extremus antarcticus TaxID=702011 RepID=A0AAJ0GIG3_9PEZI|nr:hypothetical protein LTR09_001249 [Extremus antarcticus]